MDQDQQQKVELAVKTLENWQVLYRQLHDTYVRMHTQNEENVFQLKQYDDKTSKNFSAVSLSLGSTVDQLSILLDLIDVTVRKNIEIQPLLNFVKLLMAAHDEEEKVRAKYQ